MAISKYNVIKREQDKIDTWIWIGTLWHNYSYRSMTYYDALRENENGTRKEERMRLSRCRGLAVTSGEHRGGVTRLDACTPIHVERHYNVTSGCTNKPTCGSLKQTSGGAGRSSLCYAQRRACHETVDIYRTWTFISMFTRALHLTLSSTK
jgi:hypothetical protein